MGRVKTERDWGHVGGRKGARSPSLAMVLLVVWDVWPLNPPSAWSHRVSPLRWQVLA